METETREKNTFLYFINRMNEINWPRISFVVIFVQSYNTLSQKASAEI